MEIADDAFSHHLTNTIDLLQCLHVSRNEGIHRLEMTSQQAGRSLAHKTDAESEDDTLERHFLRLKNATHNLLGRLGATAVTINLLHVNIIEVGYILDQATTIILIYSLRP